MRGLVDSQVQNRDLGRPALQAGQGFELPTGFPPFQAGARLVTTCWPGARPERISCRLPSSIFPAWTSARLNWLPPAGR